MVDSTKPLAVTGNGQGKVGEETPLTIVIVALWYLVRYLGLQVIR